MSYLQRILGNRNTLYLTAADFLESAVEYFEWAQSKPLQRRKGHFDKDGHYSCVDEPLERPYTWTGLALYTGYTTDRIHYFAKRTGVDAEEWKEAYKFLDAIMYTQKFEGAAVGIFNSTIISRDLGLADKQEVVTEDVTEPPVPPDQDHMAIYQHPDDPDPLNLPRPLYSRAQLDMGVPFTPPQHEKHEDIPTPVEE